MGEAAGDVTKRITAYNNGVEDALVDVRSDDTNLVYNTSAQSIEALSSDADDDGTATGTLTLVSAVADTQADGTATLSAVVITDFCTINGLVYTAVSGSTVEGEFDIDGDDDADAVDLARAINEDTRTGTEGDCAATSASNVVTITTDVLNADGNDVTLTTDDATIVVSGSGTLTGGLDADIATVNGLTYTGVAGTKANNTEFSIDTSDTAAALDLKLSINADTRTPVTVPSIDVLASSAAGVVTINAGTETANDVDLVGTANITASGATLTDVDVAGAWSVTIEGLDANFEEQSETIILNGTVAVAAVNTYIFIQRAYIKEAGTGGVNEGIITVKIVGGATQLTIAAGDQESQSANFIVPSNRKAELIRVDCGNLQDPLVVNTSHLEISTKDLTQTDSVFRLKDTISIHAETNARQDYRDGEFELESKTILQFKVIRDSGAVANKINLQYTLKIHEA